MYSKRGLTCVFISSVPVQPSCFLFGSTLDTAGVKEKRRARLKLMANLKAHGAFGFNALWALTNRDSKSDQLRGNWSIFRSQCARAINSSDRAGAILFDR